MNQQEKAAAFRALHKGGEILVLPNAWDVASARVVESEGYSAIATTSAGIAYSMGYPDGQRISRDEMMERVAQIARSVKVPVSADAEAGYGPRPEDAAATARAVIAAGAVGLNLEDSNKDGNRTLAEVSLQVERIRAVIEAGREKGVSIVLNARTDVYLLPGEKKDSDYAEAVRRLAAYRDAGADCVFLPGLRDAATIARLVKELQCPLNILVGPGFPLVSELERLGVARVSVGSGVMRAAMGLTRRIARELRDTGTYTNLEFGTPYEDMNKLFA